MPKIETNNFRQKVSSCQISIFHNENRVENELWYSHQCEIKYPIHLHIRTNMCTKFEVGPTNLREVINHMWFHMWSGEQMDEGADSIKTLFNFTQLILAYNKFWVTQQSPNCVHNHWDYDVCYILCMIHHTTLIENTKPIIQQGQQVLEVVSIWSTKAW